MTFKEYMTEVNGIMLDTDRSIYTGKQLEEIAEAYYQYKTASDGDLANVSNSYYCDCDYPEPISDYPRHDKCAKCTRVIR